MQERLMNRTANLAIWMMVVVVFALIVMMDRAGMPQKWHAAMVGTGVTFGGVATAYQRKWRYRRFWISLGFCFLGHVLLMWIVFEKFGLP
jgi:hypothetical protein